VPSSSETDVHSEGTELTADSSVSLRDRRVEGGGEIGIVCAKPWLAWSSDPGNSTGPFCVGLTGVWGGEEARAGAAIASERLWSASSPSSECFHMSVGVFGVHSPPSPSVDIAESWGGGAMSSISLSMRRGGGRHRIFRRGFASRFGVAGATTLSGVTRPPRPPLGTTFAGYSCTLALKNEVMSQNEGQIVVEHEEKKYHRSMSAQRRRAE
jgi:hypothetical protein